MKDQRRGSFRHKVRQVAKELSWVVILAALIWFLISGIYGNWLALTSGIPVPTPFTDQSQVVLKIFLPLSLFLAILTRLLWRLHQKGGQDGR